MKRLQLVMWGSAAAASVLKCLCYGVQLWQQLGL
jgi:hypothetical protein